MGKNKAHREYFQTDLRKERSPCINHVDLSMCTADLNMKRVTPEMNTKLVEKMLPAGLSLQQFDQPTPRMTRIDSYRAPPLKLTLETIEEDEPENAKPDFLQRSKSLPSQNRFPKEHGTGHGFQGLQCLNKLPSYRHGQGDYLPGGCGVSMSGPILPSEYTDFTTPKHRSRFSKMREALRSSRFRQAFGHFISRMRPTSRRSH